MSGWVLGAWGEASHEIHGLVKKVASANLEVIEMQPGRRGPAKSREAQLAGFTAYIRRQLSHLAVQQQSRLLLDRLELLGDGAGEAARRRAWAVSVERGAERERRAQAVCQRQARPLVRSGFALLD